MKTLIKIFLFLGIFQVSAQDSTVVKAVVNGKIYNVITGQGLGAAGNDVLTEQSLTADYTMIASDWDSGKKVFYNNTANDYVVTVPDLAQVGEKVIFSQYSTGKIQVGMAPGVLGDSFQTIDSTSNITMYKSGAVGYRNVGVSNPYTPIPPQLYNTANAVSRTNESNSLTGITEVGAGTLSIQSTGAIDGTHYVRFTGSGGTSERVEITWSGLTIGQAYNFKVWLRSPSGGEISLNQWTNVQQIGGGTADPAIGGSQVNINHTDWQEYTFPLEPTATSGIARIYVVNGGTHSAEIDGFSITLKQ